jgi:hypothetical protein
MSRGLAFLARLTHRLDNPAQCPCPKYNLRVSVCQGKIGAFRGTLTPGVPNLAEHVGLEPNGPIK